MVINPFILMLTIYFIANTYAFFNVVQGGGFFAFDNFYDLSIESIIVTYILQVFFFVITYLFYYGFFKKQSLVVELGDRYGYFLLFITVSFFIFNLSTGAGKAGSGFSFEETNIFNYLFVLLQPDIWFLIVAPFLRSKRLFWLVSVVFLFSLLSRGWMGSVLIIFLVYLIRYYPVKVTLKNSFLFFILGIILALLLPVFDALKWGLRSSLALSVIFSNLLAKDYWTVFTLVFESVIDRFQNFKYAAYTIQNSMYFQDQLFIGNISWFYQNGILSAIYCKFTHCPTDLNIYVAETMVGEVGLTWNVDPGLSGWVGMLGIYSPFIFAFTLLILFFSAYFFRRVIGTRGVLLFFTFSLLYFFHGWFNPFFNLVLYSFVFYFLLKLRVLCYEKNYSYHHGS